MKTSFRRAFITLLLLSCVVANAMATRTDTKNWDLTQLSKTEIEAFGHGYNLATTTCYQFSELSDATASSTNLSGLMFTAAEKSLRMYTDNSGIMLFKDAFIRIECQKGEEFIFTMKAKDNPVAFTFANENTEKRESWSWQAKDDDRIKSDGETHTFATTATVDGYIVIKNSDTSGRQLFITNIYRQPKAKSFAFTDKADGKYVKTVGLLDNYDADAHGFFAEMWGTETSGVEYTNYSFSDDVAKIDGNRLRLIHPGSAEVTAEVHYLDGTSATIEDKLHLVVTAQDLTQSASAEQSTFETGQQEGYYTTHTFSDVPGIRLTSGFINELTVVKNVGTEAKPVYAMMDIDANGFTFPYQAEDKAPSMGTAFKFTPQVAGTLVVKGRFLPSDTQTLSLMDSNGNVLKTFTGSGKDEDQTFTMTWGTGDGDLTLGATSINNYYLATASQTNVFALTSFTFTPSFYFVDSNNNRVKGVLGNNAMTGTNQMLIEESFRTNNKVSYSAQCLGNVKGCTVGSDGSLSRITYNTTDAAEQGGAIIVTATLENMGKTYYVLNIPYKHHVWSFGGKKTFGSVLDRTGSLAGNNNWDLIYPQFRNHR